MENRVGFRFIPTDEEIVDYYLRLKNLGGDTSHVDKAISTVDICSFEPWELPSKSRRESRDQIWYFFGRKENKYNRGERQSRITKSGFWKKTGVTTNIIRKRGNREKIGEKRVLVFHSNSEWVMHEYVSTFLSPTQTTYTVCKVIFKGDPRDLPSSSSSAPGGGGGEVEHNHSQFTHMNNSGEFEGLQNQRHFTGLLDAEKETQIHDALCRGLDSVSTHDLNSFINCGNNDEEHVNLLFMQENRNDYRPKISLTGFIDHSDDEDSDSDLISATTTGSIQTSSACDSFGSSNRRIDQITDLQNSPNSTTKLMSPTQVVRKTSLDASKEKSDVQGNEMGEYYKMDQEVINKKRGSFFYRKIRSCIKKTLLCSPPTPQEHDN
ncbi:PREDICTED: NAC domain-containing protein 5-like [Brassica oleracea var. oleracea]|uniref:NAC domain-containing protein 5-like n=1 Tax=Brassica oleracea var. oleracea TaxID=109376 RepID=UPI0006A6A982|nr:PREDICTED: NAC domain-containing protein 5-like [Brassica oleracea var. oleracea]